MASPTELLGDLQRTAPDAQVVARNLVKSASSLGRTAPPVAHLTTAITDILPESHIKGASVLKITMLDSDFTLLDSGFFSSADDGISGKLVSHGKVQADKKKKRTTGNAGRLDPLEVNYPQGSEYWWRLSTCSPTSNGTITLTFIDRVADELMQLRGPYKAARAQMTRAEFLKLVASHVPEVQFHSDQLHVKEPIDPIDAGGTNPSSKPNKKTGKKTGKKHKGIGANFGGLYVKGQLIGDRQIQNANIILNVAHQENAGEAATVAAIYAAIWESNLEQYADKGRFWGVLSASHANFAQFDTAGMAKAFFRGGSGFQGGGAIHLEQSGVTNPAEIAIKVEVASIWPDNAYAKESAYPGDAAAIDEARAIVQAGGGASSGSTAPGSLGAGATVEVVQPYNFEIGTSSNAKETLWDGEQRLAQEVNWELFTDGPHLYYDSDMTLIKQKPSAVIHRRDVEVIDWSYDWENRNIATQFNLTLICEPFKYRAGEVMILNGFGQDQASTANLPGRWLIADAVKLPRSLATQFTLVQPTQPKNEPAPQVVAKTVAGTTDSSSVSGPVNGITNPAPGSSPGRLDMGQDGGYGPGGAVAAYDGVVHVVPGGPGWPGEGDYIWLVNSDQSGPDYTRAIYYAEGAVAVVKDGAQVKAGQKIGQPVAHGGTGAPGNFEIGPANTSNGDCLAKQYGLGSAGAAKMVKAFSKLLQDAGMPAPTSTGNAGAA